MPTFTPGELTIMRLVDGAGPAAAVVTRLTLLLAAAWLAQVAVARANPRWRVLAWRLAVVGLILVPLATFCVPAIRLRVLPSIDDTAQSRSNQRTPTRLVADRTSATLPAREVQLPAAPPPASETTLTASVGRSLPSSSPQPRAAAVPPSRIDWAWLGWAIWLLGVAVGCVGEVAAAAKLHGLRRRSRPASDAVCRLGSKIAAQLGCRKPFQIRQTRDLDSPCVFGVLRPVILVTDVDCREEHRGALPAILAHEISHLRGADVPWNGALRLVARLLWFHPLIWHARRAHASACDAVCDATAADLLGDVTRYGRTLAQLALRAAPASVVPALEMARPSSVRRRIEALHRRLYTTRLPRLAVVASIAMALSLGALCGTLSLAHAAPDTDGLAVSGRVLDDAGQPIEGATVYVYSAGVREGTSPYCPTCYADCGKRATSDAEGRFTIGGLDSTLIFRLLAVAEGHRPKFVSPVDPQTAEAVAVKLAARPIPDDPSRVVRGRVISPHGTPAVGATVESYGCKTAEKRWWGRMDGVDPLAVTDEQGEFVLVCDAPVEALDLSVEARGAARRKFELVKAGTEGHRLELETGVTVTGRVLDGGRPVPGVSIGIAQTDRSAGKFLGPYQIGTDDEGRFLLPNLPAGVELAVYGIMDSLRDRGALPSKKFNPGEGGVTDLGDLSLVPAHTLRGRIALADGKPIPAHTRVMFNRADAWDSSFAEAAADGTFSIGGIPPEVISVIVSIRGYRLSPKNASFDPLNGSSLEGVVAHDIDDLVVLYEPGKPVRPDYSRDFSVVVEKHRRLQNQTLAGVKPDLEAFPPKKLTVASAPKRKPKPLPKIDVPPKQPTPAAAKDGPTQTLTGTVVDHQGDPVGNSQLWLPVQWLSAFETLTAAARGEETGAFELAFPRAWVPEEKIRRNPIVWAYAQGHAIGTGNAHEQLFGDEPAGPFQIELPPASDLSFVVHLPDGQPAVGATVEPVHFKTQRAYDLVPHGLAELLAGTTDAAGRAAMPALTRDGVYTVDVKLAGYGTQRFRCDMKSTDPAEQTLQLRPVGRIEGRVVADQLELVRDMVVSVETRDLDPGNLRAATGTSILEVDEQGRFVIPEIAVGRMDVSAKCDERLPVRPRLPARQDLTLLEDETIRLEIPLEMTVPVHGVVRAKDTGEPVAGATLSVRYGVGRQGDHVITDENGRFSARVLTGDVYVQAISLPDGYLQLGEPWEAKRTVTADTEWPPIEVVPTMSLAGTVVDRDGEPLANVRINGVVGNRRYGFGSTDEKGRFTLTRLPRDVELEKYEIWTRDEHFSGIADATDPLVVRVQP